MGSAFGDEKPTTAHNRFANLDLTPNPGTMGIAETVFNLGWPSQYYDKESGLFCNYFRSLDPRTGRYTQFDPTGLSGGWNGFGYVHGNPLRFADPLGLQASPDDRPSVSGPSYRIPLPPHRKIW